MNVERKVKDAMARYERAAGMIRLAAAMPPPPADEEQKSNDEGGAGLTRNIPKNHPYDPNALKPLAKMLWAMSVSMGHALTAYRAFTRLKSSMISPDGLLGGRGYIMSVKEVRRRLYEACEALSSISDTIHDEINAGHWKPRLDDLGQNDAEDVKKYLDEAQQNLENPEADAEEEAAEMEAENDGPDGTPNDERWGDENDEDEPGSELPNGGESTAFQGQAPSLREQMNKQSSTKIANSSVPPSTLPGPRVEHLQPEHGYGPYGSENKDEPLVADPWGQNQGVSDKNPYVVDEPAPHRVNTAAEADPARIAVRNVITAGNMVLEYAKQHGLPRGNTLRAASVDELRATLEAALQQESPIAQSGLPTDNSPRDGFDFGLGDGADGKGVHVNDKGEPSAGLPNDPGGKLNPDVGDALPHQSLIQQGGPIGGGSELPNDGEPPVNRSDYFDGPMGNVGVGSPVAESGLPGDGTAAPFNYQRSYPRGGGYQQSRGDIPFVERPSR